MRTGGRGAEKARAFGRGVCLQSPHLWSIPVFDLILKTLLAIATLWLLTSVGVFLYWIQSPVPFFERWRARRASGVLVATSALLGTGVLVGYGVFGELWFLPRSWGGYDEDGAWVSARFNLSVMAGLSSAFLITNVASAALRDRERAHAGRVSAATSSVKRAREAFGGVFYDAIDTQAQRSKALEKYEHWYDLRPLAEKELLALKALRYLASTEEPRCEIRYRGKDPEWDM